MKQQKHKLIKRVLSVVLSLSMALCLIPGTVFAAEGEGNVAKIGEQTYATVDAAIEAAKDGDTITLLQDVTATKTFYKSLTFTGGHTLNMDVYGWRYTNHDLVFDNANLHINSDSDSPVANNSEPGRWFTMVFNASSITAKNSANIVFEFDSTSGTNCAIYAGDGDGAAINVDNNSTFKIYGKNTQGIEGQGIQLGNTAGAGIFVTNGSEFLIDGTNRGYVNSPTVYVKNSNFTVQNCTNNGSNGGNYTAINSTIKYINNAVIGLSADTLKVQNSKVYCTGNGGYGIAANNVTIDGTSVVDVSNNATMSGFAGFMIRNSGTVQNGAKLTINGNQCKGLYLLNSDCKVTIEEGVDLTIMNNYDTTYGGGVRNQGKSLSLPSDAKIYNNHAGLAGDDIYCSRDTTNITFGPVGNGWALDGGPDCEHLIDGWYDDSEGARWEAHAATEDGNHIEEFTGFGEDGLATVTGLKALKAAHGIDAKDKTSYPGMDKVIVSNGEEVINDSVAAGDTVNFKLESNVPDDLMNYINPTTYPPTVEGNTVGEEGQVDLQDRGKYEITIHDQMNEAFVDMTTPVVMLDRAGDKNDVTLTQDTNYTYITTTDDGCTFHIVIDLIALYENGIITDADITNATPITVTYTAKLNKDTTAGSYENTAWVAYPGDESEKPQVTVDTYGIKIFKYDPAHPTIGLKDAVFEIYQKDESGAVITDSKVELTSGDDGYATLNGLDSGTYYIKETQAPEGYVCSDQELTITIPEQAGTDNIVTVNFANTQIPHTGGMGTTLYTVGGGLIVAAAAVLFVVSRKKRQSK